MNFQSIQKSLRPYKTELFLLAILLAAYVPVLRWMWTRWFVRDTYYSHGILVPFVSGYLIWQQRAVLAATPRRSSGLGLGIAVAGLLLYMLSALFRVNFTAGFSLLIVLWGLVINRFGLEITRTIAFPLAFLFFMFPLPEVAIVNISFRMKIFAAGIAEQILNNMGLPAIRQGSIIYMQHTQVVVDDVCSGLRSLISLTALGSIFAYWINGPTWKRLVLFLTTIPIAVITNVCRVVFLSAVSEIWGADAATGLVHDASGFLVFALAFMLLWGVGKVLE